MKKTLSVFLAVVLFALPLCMNSFASANDTPAEVCRVTVAESSMYTVEPCEGYDFYVVKGSPFKFTLKPAEGYSLDMVSVYYEPTSILDNTQNEGYFKQVVERNPNEITYTIDAVNTDITIHVAQVLPKGQGYFFRSLMEFIYGVLIFIASLFGIPTD